MVASPPNRIESLPHSNSGLERQEKPSELQAREALGVGVDASGILDSIEGGAEPMGHVSESAREGVGEQQQSSGGKFQQFSQQMNQEDAATLKAKLLQSPPSQRQMIRQIRSHIHREIEQLDVLARKSSKTGQLYEFNEAVRKSRELRLLLKSLFRATSDFVRNLWLKVVHGIV